MQIERWRTALRRSTFSKPIKLALRDGVIRKDTSVLDYGCGRGDDVRLLRRRGYYQAHGWDPAPAHFSVPGGPPTLSPRALSLLEQVRRATFYGPRLRETFVRHDVVNLGYVVNTIEDEAERRKTIEQAWGLTRGVLIITVRTDKIDGKPFQDGVLTKAGTFQKSYKGWELVVLIERTFNAMPREAWYHAHVTPEGGRNVGVLYIFRTKKFYNQYQAQKDARPSRRATNKPLSGQKEKV